MKTINLFILFLFIGTFGFHKNIQAEVPINEAVQIPYFDYIKFRVNEDIDVLHKIKIDDVKSIEEKMEAMLAHNAELLYSVAKEDKTISKKDIDSIYGQLILLSIMNEKFHIENWQENDYLQQIFKEVQLTNKEQTSKLRCFNWSKPMWVDRGCAKN